MTLGLLDLVGVLKTEGILKWDNFLMPLANKVEKAHIAGRGTNIGPVSVKEHVEILKAQVCPMLHGKLKGNYG